jgi:hypothetical protein
MMMPTTALTGALALAFAFRGFDLAMERGPFAKGRDFIGPPLPRKPKKQAGKDLQRLAQAN